MSRFASLGCVVFALLVLVHPALLLVDAAVSVDLEPRPRPQHYYPGIHFHGDEHPSHFPSVKIESRPVAEQEVEIAKDDARFEELYHSHLLDAEATPIQSSFPHRKEEVYDAATASFLEKASTTLNSVMQHDPHAIYHYKQLVIRAKSALTHRKYDEAATLFKEASKFYVEKLKEPYAKIATSKDLGATIEQRISAQLEAERAAGASGSVSTANTAAQQFREKELQNQPHVHTAFLEYQKTLKNVKNAQVEKKAAESVQRAAATAAVTKQRR